MRTIVYLGLAALIVATLWLRSASLEEAGDIRMVKFDVHQTVEGQIVASIANLSKGTVSVYKDYGYPEVWEAGAWGRTQYVVRCGNRDTPHVAKIGAGETLRFTLDHYATV